MRIISGHLKKRALIPPKDLSIRPTTDRQRESLFNILRNMNVIIDANVLDLFSGTGALGLEALSCGAGSIVFVDNSIQSIRLIKSNIKQFRVEYVTKVIKSNILKSLACLNDKIFDLILMDPPYHRAFIDKTLCNIINQQCLDINTIIVAEHAADEIISVPDKIKLFDSRKYGNTKFSFFQLS
jgi:16S rRNA (guanine(966)-N(2))-methyltransferase RsmD